MTPYLARYRMADGTEVRETYQSESAFEASMRAANTAFRQGATVIEVEPKFRMQEIAEMIQ